MTGKMRQQRPTVQLPDRANTSLALPAQGVPLFPPFPPPASVFRSRLDTPIPHAAVSISVVCSVLLCGLGLRRHCWHILLNFGGGGCMVASSSTNIKMNT